MAQTDVSGGLPAPPDAVPGNPPLHAASQHAGREAGGRLAGLDGLRAIAVLAVLIYHADLGVLSGGFLGVDVFFVISGFLITTLLLAERDRLGRIRLREFWLRRARRLLPALFLVLAGTIVMALVLAPDEVARVRGDTLAALAYVTNWYLILRQQSYFEAVGRPSPLLHLWSLAVEEQFYVLWPLLLTAGLLIARRRGMLVLTILGAAGSAILMAALFVPGVDPSRVYYGTDTHAVGLLVGAALALAWSPAARTTNAARSPEDRDAAAVSVAPSALPPWPEADEVADPLRRASVRSGRASTLAASAAGIARSLPWWDAAGIGGLALMGACFWLFDEYEPWLYRGGFVALAIVTATVIVASVRPGGWLGARVLDRQPLRWIGERSYGIYLWHWPIFTMTRSQLDVSLDPIPDLALRLALTLLAAESSYRFIETPVRQGALGRAWRAWRSVPRERRVSTYRWPIATSGAVLVLAVVVGARVAGATAPPPPSYLAVTSIDTGGPAAASAGPVGSPSASASTEPPESQPPQAAAGMPAGSAGSPAPTSTGHAAGSPPPATARPLQVLAIGDSVMLGAVTQLRQAVHGIEVNAAIGRSFGVGVQILQQRQKQGLLPGAVVIGLGDNGWITSDEIDQVMHVLHAATVVVFVNLKEPRSWEAHDNAVLADAAKRYPNVVVVDWHDASDRHAEYFWDDGIHLRPVGAAAYARLVAAALTPVRGAAASPAPPASVAPSPAGPSATAPLTSASASAPAASAVPGASTVAASASSLAPGGTAGP
jgi:peptidoglycan/LPS O-acetylase OafA/YrhL